MDLNSIFKDKSLNAKGKTEQLAAALISKMLSPAQLVAHAENAKESDRATCLEAAEHITKDNPSWCTNELLELAVRSLDAKAPRLKWEAARLIGNCAVAHPSKIHKALPGLLTNSEDPGTVVRWSSAFAIGEILKLKSKLNSELIPAVNSIIEREEKNSIRKIYQQALKKIS